MTTYHTSDDNWRIVVLKGRHTHRHRSHHRYATKDPDQGPEGDDQIPEGPGRLVPAIPQEMGDGTRHPVPWRSRDEWINEGINIEMPSRPVHSGPGWGVWMQFSHGGSSFSFSSQSLPLSLSSCVREQKRRTRGVSSDSKTSLSRPLLALSFILLFFLSCRAESR